MTLVRLVRSHGTVPVPLTGPRASFPRPVMTALAKRGLVEKIGYSQITDALVVSSTEDLRDGGGVPPRFTATVAHRGASERVKWWAVVMDEGPALVRAHLV